MSAVITLCVALCSVALTLPCRAGESMLTLAMVKTETHPERRVPLSKEQPPIVPSAFKSTGSSVAAKPIFQLSSLEKISPVSTLLLQKSPQRETRNLLNTRLGASASIQAGYGEIYADKTPSIYGHNGTGWQEPSCGYVKIHFRF